MNTKLNLWDILITQCMNILELSWTDENEIQDKDGSILETYDFETIFLNTPISVDNDEIDCVLVFGDGCVEFHLKNDLDAVNWGEFDDEIIIKVIEDLSK
jgi:hypothetical protein